MSKNDTVEAYFINETLGDDFTNILGALLLAGWTYSVENSCDDEGSNRVKIVGHRTEKDGSLSTKSRPVQIVWQRVVLNGETFWTVVADETGHPLKKPGAGGRMVQYVAPDKMVDTIGRGASEWNLLPFDEDELKSKVEEDKKAAREARKAQRQAKRKAKSEQKAIGSGSTPTEEPEADEPEAEATPENGIVSEEVIEG